MPRRLLFIILFIFFGILSCENFVQAGFGISPPYLMTKKPLFPGSHYEQKITLLRSSAEEELQAEVKVNAPEVESWISVKNGMIFDMPKDKLQVPMIIQVDVPEDAEIGDYGGYINIRIVPKSRDNPGVAVALGARIDIHLAVTDKTFIDFLVRKVEIRDIEKLGKPWNWKIFSWFFYRVKVIMKIENTGNVKVAPTKVSLDIYDLAETELLESHDDMKIKKIDPFTIEEVVATFPTELDVGQYWGKIKIYKEEKIVYKNKTTFTIEPHGKLLGGTKLGIWPWIMLSGLILTGLIIIFILIKIKIWRYIFKILYIISWPIRYIWQKIRILAKIIKIKFWKWMHKKSAHYQDIDDESIMNNSKQSISDKTEEEDQNKELKN